ncbi:MAG: SDR family oxidoreductase [Burkholderiales bacterium]|nr:SDR family oxidoreductase [Burkholderiales bacterium]
MNVCVTGANGFVGRALCERLALSGHAVTRVVRRPEIAALAGSRCLSLTEPNATDWKSALIGTEILVHLAARVHVMSEALVDPLAEFRRINCAGTEQLASAAAKAGVRRFVFISTVKVHGEGGESCFRESDAPAPTDAYAISKWEAEQALLRIAAETALEVVILRPTLVYGPGVRGNFLSLLRAVERGIPLPLASIDNRRSLIYLGNLIDAIMACIEHPSAAGKTYLVSDGDDVSTTELVRRLAAALGKPARVFPFPLAPMRFAATLLRRGAALNRLASSLRIDSTKIREELGWAPPYTMQQGLRETADWYRRRKTR